MRLEPPNLDIPLYRRDWSTLWFALASCGCAWLWHRSVDPSLAIISVALGGPVFFFALGPALRSLRRHRSLPVRALFFVGAVVGVVLVMNHLVPALHSYAQSGVSSVR